MKTEDKEILVRYLLGDLPEDEREHIEREYFADHETLQFLHSVEDDLIDAYVRGGLSPGRRRQFEGYFLNSPSMQQRVEFARTLWLAPQNQEEPGAPGKAAGVPVRRRYASWPALAAALFVVLAAFLLIQNWRLGTRLGQAQSAQTELQNQIRQLQEESAALAAEVKSGAEWPLSANGESISMLLVPNLLRDGDSRHQRLVIPPDTSSVLLVLRFQGARRPFYRAVLQTAEGTLVRKFDALKSRDLPGGGQAVVLSLTSQALKRGDYVIRLFAQTDQGQAEELHPYSFSAKR